MSYANPDERTALVGGFRALADYLETSHATAICKYHQHDSSSGE